MRVTRPSWFDVSFSDALGNQLLVITQAHWFGTELGLFANPTDGTWQCECGISCLVQSQPFSQWPLPIEQNGPTRASHMASVRPALPSWTMSSTVGTCYTWDGGAVTLSSLVEVTCTSKQYCVSGQSGVGFLARDWDGDHDGVLPNGSESSGPFWLLGGARVWPLVWILIPDFWSSRSLSLAAIDTKTVAMNWNSG